MNEKELNIQSTDDELLMPTAHEALVIRRAMRRMHIPAPDVDEEWAKFAETHHKATQVMPLAVNEVSSKATPSSKKAHFIGFFLGVAASVAVLFALFPLLKSHFTPNETINGVQIFCANDNPSEVMLAQDEEKAVAVKSGSLAFNAESAENKAAETKKASPKILTLTTPRGKDYKITLADGTKVWMNAESKLEFPKTFIGDTREVTLHGEAYFEVAKDAKHPFIVKTDYFQTKVLGTSFNIRAYSERDANVVLIEGSVSLLANKKNASNSITMIPNQQALLNVGNGQFSVREVDTYPYTQWRDGFFYFDDTPMIEIMQELGRWYNVNIIFEEAKFMNTHLHFVAERGLSLADIIRYINDMGIVKVEIQKDAVIVN